MHNLPGRFSQILTRWLTSPFFIVALAPLFWAGNGVLGRGVRGVIPPVSLAFWRWFLAFLFVSPFAWRYLRADWPVVRPNWRILLFLSFTGITCFNTLQYTALQTTTAMNNALLQTLMPAVIILFSWLFWREKISALQGVGLLVCSLGAVLVVSQGSWGVLRSLQFVRGDLIMLGALVIYASYSVGLSKRPAMHGLSFLMLSFGLGTLMLFPLYLWEIAAVGPFPLTLPVLGSLLYVGIFPSILSYLCWNYGVASIGSNRTGLFINLLPVFTAGLAVTLLGEAVRWFHGVGMALIFGGILLFNHRLLKSRSRQSAAVGRSHRAP